MDPFVTVPHDHIHVHILAKQQLHGKGFDDVLSTGHISGKGRVTSIHPSIHLSIHHHNQVKSFVLCVALKNAEKKEENQKRNRENNDNERGRGNTDEI